MASGYAYLPFALWDHLEVGQMTWFIISSVGMTGFFKTVQAANGLFPPGSTSAFGRFLRFFTAVPPEEWVKEKPVKAKPGALAAKVGSVVSGFAGLSLLLSFLLSSDDFFPLGSDTYAIRLVGSFFQMWSIILLFLGFVLDVGALLTLLNGVQPIKPFHEPLTTSTSFKNAWGERWNMVVHSYLKSCVYKPCLRVGIPKLPTAVITFFASGLLHEYMYMLHNAASYEFGKVCMFFVSMGGLMVLEQYLLAPIVPAPLKQAWARLPGIVTGTILALLSCVSFDPLYMASWRKSGMLRAMAGLFVTYRCS